MGSLSRKLENFLFYCVLCCSFLFGSEVMRRELNNQNISKIASLLLYRPFMLQIRFQLSFQRDDNWIIIPQTETRSRCETWDTRKLQTPRLWLHFQFDNSTESWWNSLTFLNHCSKESELICRQINDAKQFQARSISATRCLSSTIMPTCVTAHARIPPSSSSFTVSLLFSLSLPPSQANFQKSHTAEKNVIFSVGCRATDLTQLWCLCT